MGIVLPGQLLFLQLKLLHKMSYSWKETPNMKSTNRHKAVFAARGGDLFEIFGGTSDLPGRTLCATGQGYRGPPWSPVKVQGAKPLEAKGFGAL